MNSSSSSSTHLARQHGFARAMRREPTASEHAIWLALRSSQLSVGFRRQALVAGYFVDFLAPSRRLIVEVDGGYHRSPAALVLGDLPAAVGVIRTVL